MKNSIDVLCSSCNQRFQAPVSYQGNTVLCVHCKASVLALEAPSLEPPQIVNAVSKSTPKSSQGEVSLWDKLNSFKFKELTKKEIIICVAGVCLLIGSIVSTMKDKESKKQVAEFDKHVDEHNEFIRNNNSGGNESLAERRVPVNSGFDGGVNQVKRYIKDTAKDPSSIKFIEWSAVEKLSSREYRVRAKYRGKNGFGGFSIENKIFYLRFKEYDYQVYRTQSFPH